MKRRFTILLASAMLLALTACGSANQQKQSDTPQAQQPDISPAVQSTETEPKENAGGSGSTLVVYYSATGSTKAVAGYIANALNADQFEIVPADPYTDADLDWTDSNSRVSTEHDDASLRDIPLASSTVENWDQYDTVFIGYPIWWGIAAWPTDSFVKANDFTGKTVIPFCTSASSGFGESGELLAELAGTGDWQEGMRFRSNAAETDVVEWVNSLGINK